MADEKTDLKKQINEQKKVVSTWNKKEKAVLNEIDKIGKTLSTQKKELDVLQKDTGKIEKSLSDTAKKIKTLETKITNNEKHASDSMVALYKLRMLGSMGTLGSAESLLDLSLRKKAVSVILEKDTAAAKALLTDLEAYKAAQIDMKNKQAQLTQKANAYKSKLTQVEKSRSQNEDLLKNVAKEKNMQVAALQFMEESAKRLDEEMARINKQSQAQAKKQQQSQAQAKSTPGGKKKGAAIFKETEEVQNALAGIDESALVQKSSFAKSKGLLIMPVKGKIINKFGSYTPPGDNVKLFRKGVDIAASPKDPVAAVYGGTVVFADWFKGYGNMVIIDHGSGFYTLYARLGSMTKAKNDHVNAGEIIGDINYDEGLEGQDLYFEIRQHTQPLDPAVWLKRNV